MTDDEKKYRSLVIVSKASSFTCLVSFLYSVFQAMRIARADARLIGIREKRAKQKAEEAKMAIGKSKK